jgi:hypothetical protein
MWKSRLRLGEKEVGIMPLMRMLGVTVMWAAGVALVASISWVAINSAGRQVVDTSVVTTRADDSPAAGAGTSPAATPTMQGSSPHPGSGTAPTTPTGTRTWADATGVPATPGTSGASGPDLPPTRQSTPQQPTPPPGPGPLSDTKSTAGGVVWLECTGPRVTSLWVQPSDDWSADPRKRNLGRIDVYFTRLRTTTLEVVGTCLGGQPHFEVQSHEVVKDDGHDGGDEDGDRDDD